MRMLTMDPGAVSPDAKTLHWIERRLAAATIAGALFAAGGIFAVPSALGHPDSVAVAIAVACVVAGLALPALAELVLRAAGAKAPDESPAWRLLYCMTLSRGAVWSILLSASVGLSAVLWIAALALHLRRRSARRRRTAGPQ